MSITPTEILANAKSLPQGSEAEIRTKISRLYYALYSHACEFNDQLPSEGSLLKRDGGSHTQLSQKLTNPSVEDNSLKARSRDLGTKQRLAHELRVKADYHLNESVSGADLLKCTGYVTRGMEISAADSSSQPMVSNGAKPTLTRIR